MWPRDDILYMQFDSTVRRSILWLHESSVIICLAHVTTCHSAMLIQSFRFVSLKQIGSTHVPVGQESPPNQAGAVNAVGDTQRRRHVALRTLGTWAGHGHSFTLPRTFQLLPFPFNGQQPLKYDFQHQLFSGCHRTVYHGAHFINKEHGTQAVP